MVLNFNKKGQAAIEFLMTYGWMLLVVLIVGALIFSFVDIDSLVPNQLELDNDLRAEATSSVAYADDYTANTGDQNLVYVDFKYNGAGRVTISPYQARLDLETGGRCWATSIWNNDLNKNVTTNVAPDNGDNTDGGVDKDLTGYLAFLSGQTGTAVFDCDEYDGDSASLMGGDRVVGTIYIFKTNPKTNRPVPSSGKINLKITK